MDDTFQSNPYGSFDPSQWSNKYSNYNGAALPWPSQYAGWPTDAMGNPIQPQPGMTLNQTPAQPQAPQQQAAAQQVGPMTGGQYGDWRALAGPSPGGPGTQDQWAYNLGLGGLGPAGDLNPGSAAGRAYAARQQTQQAAQPAAAPQATSTPLQVGNPLTAAQYLQLKANPGHVTTPGATVPQANSQQGGPGVLQQFLANWAPASSGPGSGFQQNFSKALKGFGY